MDPDSPSPAEPPPAPRLAVDPFADIKAMRDTLTRFMLQYKFGLDEISTKIGILRQEFEHMHDYNPIEHVSSRLKSPESIVEKVQRKGLDLDVAVIREEITDIAGVRITCSFGSDVYPLFELLTGQPDVRVVRVKDYIARPKPNGYKSLHAIVEIPVFLSGGVVPVLVEVQFRTIAMDFWASLEHKIYYKYDRQVPQELLDGLREAAVTAGELDDKMERLHREVRGGRGLIPGTIDPGEAAEQPSQLLLSEQLLRAFQPLSAELDSGPVDRR